MSTLTVGTGQQYTTLASAIGASHDGDLLQVQAGTYTNDFATINTRITIQGVGGMAKFVATTAIPNGKAILITNADVTIDHLEFAGATVTDGNGAGIRYQAGKLAVTNSYFHDNQNGILGAASAGGTISISTSEFSHNGSGTGYTHNIYVGDIASLTIDHSYFHDAVVGHEIKSRAETTTITNSRIQDGPAGTASYSIDLPNAGNATIQNNVIEQGPNSQNPAIIAYGEEGGVYSGSALLVSGNTVLNDLASSSASAVWNATSTVSASVTGNSFYGLSSSQILKGPGTVSGSTMLTSEPALDTSSPITSSTVAPITSTLVLNMSEDAYKGDAQFIVKIDGMQLGGIYTTSASHSAGQSQAFTFTGITETFSPHDIAISYINDAWGRGAHADRNLYVNSMQFDTQAVAGTPAAFYTTSTQHFTATAPANWTG